MLDGVSVGDDGKAWAVGAAGDGRFEQDALAERWTGSRWEVRSP
jgi:hypothetical protein